MSRTEKIKGICGTVVELADSICPEDTDIEILREIIADMIKLTKRQPLPQHSSFSNLTISEIQKIEAYKMYKIQTIDLQIGFDALKGNEIQTMADVSLAFNIKWFPVTLKSIEGDPMDATLRLCVGSGSEEHEVFGIKINDRACRWRDVYSRIKNDCQMNAKMNGKILTLTLNPVTLSFYNKSQDKSWAEIIGVPSSHA